MSAQPGPDLVEGLAAHDVVVCCGSGGVGKTTVSAALALALAAAGRTVLVLTIDPARRLATALGLDAIGTRPVAVPVRGSGRLSAAMLDAGSEWDRLVARHAPSAEVRDRILASPFYRGVSTAFAGSQEYVALEALATLREEGEHDCLVVDTPPSRSALDILEAPERVTDFVGVRLLDWLAAGSPGGWRAVGIAGAPLLRMADRLLGTDVLEQLATFVADFRTLYAGVRRRAETVHALLRAEGTAFVVVTTLEPRPLSEAEFLAGRLRASRMPARAVVVNRVLPASVADAAAAAMARRLAEAADPRVRRAAQAYLALSAMAGAEAAQVERLGRLGGAPVARVPLATRDMTDLAALRWLADQLRGGVTPPARPSRASAQPARSTR